MMEIEVRLYNEFKRYAPARENVFAMALPAGSTMGDVRKRLQIPPERRCTVLLNGRRAAEETRLESGSTLVFFSPVSGG
jgi:molybdopterin converting factor small subunit